MSKYIKSFDSAAELISYFNTAEGKKYYTLMNTAGEEGIGTSVTSGKKIISAWKPQYDYLTFTAVEAGATVRYNSTTHTTAEYSIDGGITWNNGVGITVTLANIGDSVKYRGVISGNVSSYSSRFTFNSNKISASGSVMSMYNCGPDDTVIAYNGAFMCMFKGCSSLTTAPSLPATTLANSCHYQMFSGCTSLTSAPELPATTLVAECYESMFEGCTSLTSAPELPATTLAEYCYLGMFENCTSLNNVTHHITSWNTNHAQDWLKGVAASGIVKCPSNSTIPSNSNSGIPSGWTRENL